VGGGGGGAGGGGGGGGGGFGGGGGWGGGLQGVPLNYLCVFQTIVLHRKWKKRHI